jgi:RNA polymerase primary sigma factor
MKMRQLKISNKITTREDLALDKYLSEINKIPMLLPEKESELAVRIKQGDEDALCELTQSNLRFVVSVAKQYQNQGLGLSDLINEGNVGLMKAARRFDETKGFKFISYAVWWIRQAILHAIVEHSRIVRLPVNKAGSYNKVNQLTMIFVQENERDPTNEELAELLDVPTKEVTAMLKTSTRHVSFDAPISGEDGDATMLDLISTNDYGTPDSDLMEQSLRQEVQESLSVLSPREVQVLSSYFGLNGQKALTLEEIGERYDLTRERVRQIRERAIRRLRKSYNHNDLRSYLGGA